MPNGVKIISLLIVLSLAVAAAFFMESYRQRTTPNADLQVKKFASQQEMQDFLKAGQATFGGYGIQTLATRSGVAEDAAVPSQQKAGGSADYSRTNIQVEGVDEADIVKTDGKYIYIASQNFVTILDANPAENAKIISTLDINASVQEIFVNGNRLVVFAYSNDFYYINEKTDEIQVQEKVAANIIAPDYFPSYRYSPKIAVKVFDITDRSNPVPARDVKLDGEYYDSRMIGNYVYVIANQPIYYTDGRIPLPMLREETGGETKVAPAFDYTDITYFPYPYYSYRFTDIISIDLLDDQKNVSHSPFLLGYTQNLYVSENNIYITGEKPIPPFYEENLIIEELKQLLPEETREIIDSIKQSDLPEYQKNERIMSTVTNYINALSQAEREKLETDMQSKVQEIQKKAAEERQKTIVHKISIKDGKAEYKVSGEVRGTPLNQFSMDEYNGYFRIATTTQNWWGGGIIRAFEATPVGVQVEETSISSGIGSGSSGSVDTKLAEPSQIEPTKPIAENPSTTPTQSSPTIVPEPREPAMYNHVFVLDENMKITGKLENIAPDERIYSARFIGDRLYLVTFKQIDPLFVIDLLEPANPKILGQLKIPGVSDYLHPYDENHIIGIGRDTVDTGTTARFLGMKIALFDVSDVSNPIEKAKFIIGDRGTNSEVLYDHKAFLFNREKNLLVLPILEAKIDPTQYPEGVPEWAYGEYVFQGAYVFEITKENGFTLRGKITHIPLNDTNKYYYYGPYSIKRSLYIENNLYTLSDKAVKINSLVDLNPIKTIDLPYKEYQYTIYDDGGLTRGIAEPAVSKPSIR